MLGRSLAALVSLGLGTPASAIEWKLLLRKPDGTPKVYELEDTPSYELEVDLGPGVNFSCAVNSSPTLNAGEATESRKKMLTCQPSKLSRDMAIYTVATMCETKKADIGSAELQVGMLTPKAKKIEAFRFILFCETKP